MGVNLPQVYRTSSRQTADDYSKERVCMNNRRRNVLDRVFSLQHLLLSETIEQSVAAGAFEGFLTAAAARGVG